MQYPTLDQVIHFLKFVTDARHYFQLFWAENKEF